MHTSETLCHKSNHACNEVHHINCKKSKITKNILCGDYVAITAGKQAHTIPQATRPDRRFHNPLPVRISFFRPSTPLELKKKVVYMAWENETGFKSWNSTKRSLVSQVSVASSRLSANLCNLYDYPAYSKNNIHFVLDVTAQGHPISWRFSLLRS